MDEIHQDLVIYKCLSVLIYLGCYRYQINRVRAGLPIDNFGGIIYVFCFFGKYL